MKKVLVLMGAFLAFAACNTVSDCDCRVSGDMTDVPLFTDEQATLVELEGEIIWESSDKTVAVVDDNGLVSQELQDSWLDETGNPGNLTLSCVER